MLTYINVYLADFLAFVISVIRTKHAGAATSSFSASWQARNSADGKILQQCQCESHSKKGSKPKKTTKQPSKYPANPGMNKIGTKFHKNQQSNKN